MSKFQRHKLRITGVVVFVALIFGISVHAQDQDQGTIRVAVNLVLMDATVKTKDGQIMANLKKDDFEVREDGVVQKVEVFSRDELPLDVALVLDLSDSIGPFPGAVARCLDGCPRGSEARRMKWRCLHFRPKPKCACRSTKDKNKIADQINTFEARGATNINDGIFRRRRVSPEDAAERAPRDHSDQR